MTDHMDDYGYGLGSGAWAGWGENRSRCTPFVYSLCPVRAACYTLHFTLNFPPCRAQATTLAQHHLEAAQVRSIYTTLLGPSSYVKD